MIKIKRFCLFIISLSFILCRNIYADDTVSYAVNGEGKRYTERKVISGIEVPYTSTLAIYDDAAIKLAADRLFSIMNPVREESKNAMILYNNGYYLEALGVMRNYMINEIRRAPLEGMQNAAFYAGADERYKYMYDMGSVIMGEMTVEEYNKVTTANNMTPLRDSGGILKFPDSKQDSHIDWTYERGVGDQNKYGIDLFGKTQYPTESILAGRYLATGDERVIEKWSQYMNDMALNHRPTFDKMIEGLSGNELVKFHRSSKFSNNLYINSITFPSGDILYLSGRYDEQLGMLSQLFNGLPDPNMDIPFGQELLMATKESKSWENILPDESYDLIDPVRFSNIMRHLSEDCFFKTTQCIYQNDAVYQNQVIGAECCCVILRAVCKDFKYPQSVTDDMVNKINSKLVGFLQPDGGYLEIAFNYNTAYDNPRLKRFGKILGSICPELSERFTADMEKHTVYYDRIQEALTSPIGLGTNIGNTRYHTTYPYWKDPERMQELREEAQSKKHGFVSAYFPYSGYGSMRQSWDPESLYMSFFTNGVRQQGHFIAGTNGIMNLTAYGRSMLISGGAPWYFKSAVPATRTHFIEYYNEINSYMYEGSTAKISTVMVNKKSQNKGISNFNADGTYADNNGDTTNSRLASVSGKVLDARWHTSDSFDFVEGTWSGGYSNVDDDRPNPGVIGEPGAIELDAIHKRKILFIKDADIWLVNDELENGTGKKNTYSQIWNFASYTDKVYVAGLTQTGYKENQVKFDNENKKIYTCDSEGPNLFIHSIGTNPIEYKKYYGYYKKGEMGFGWTNGPSTLGSDEDTGDYTPRVDIHAEWSDSGIMGEKTKVISILAPSRTTDDPILSISDISKPQDGITAVSLETKSGRKIKYYSCSQTMQLKTNGIDTLCRELLICENGDKIRGVVLDCGYFIYNSINAGYNLKDNFEFELTRDYNLKAADGIYKPDSFAWKEMEDGTYEAIYNK